MHLSCVLRLGWEGKHQAEPDKHPIIFMADFISLT
jgi:hypothetical protein